MPRFFAALYTVHKASSPPGLSPDKAGRSKEACCEISDALLAHAEVRGVSARLANILRKTIDRQWALSVSRADGQSGASDTVGNRDSLSKNNWRRRVVASC